MRQLKTRVDVSRPLVAIALAGLLFLGSGCTTVRCYDYATVSDEQPQEETTHSQQN